MSVTGGTRIEIKGVPQIWRIPRLVHNEACRQLSLLGIRNELARRGVRAETFQAEARDVTDLLDKTSFAPIRAALAAGHRVGCVRLADFAGLLNAPTQEHTTFAKEFADRVRVIACLSELPNLVHSDLAAESLWPQDWQELRRRMHATDRDVLVVVWGPPCDVRTAGEEIENRAREATVGVPSDTRQALEDGTNGFERVLPGPERMYPDTDLPPIALVPERIEDARARVPEFVWETEARFREGGMVPHDAGRLCISPQAALITRAAQELELRPLWLGVLFGQRMLAWKRAGLRPNRLAEEAIWIVLSAHAEGRLAPEGVPWLLERQLAESACETVGADEARRALETVRPVADEELATRIADARAAAAWRTFTSEAARSRHLMGRLMADLVGRVEGRRLRRLLDEDDAIPTIETCLERRARV